MLSNALQGTDTVQFEVALSTKSGIRFDMLLNATARHDMHDKIVGVICVGQDITAKKNALIFGERVGCMEDTLAATSHDVRTPIQSIVLSTDLLTKMKGQSLSAPDSQMLLTILRSSCELLLVYTANILDIHHIKDGRAVAANNSEPVDLAAELDSMITSLTGSLLQKQDVEMITEIDRSCPLVFCPKSQLVRAIMNPMMNAIRYTTQGSTSFTLQWTPVKDDQVRISIRISDTGKGVLSYRVVSGSLILIALSCICE